MFYTMMKLLVILLNICSLTSAIPEGDNSSSKLLARKRRIIGGYDTTIEECPYMVKLEVATEKSDSICGGAIIAPNVIITAAHCMKITEVDALRFVRVGSSYCDGKPYLVQKFIVHPDYDKDDMPPHDDLAIIKLELPIKLDGKTKKAIGMIGYGESVPNGAHATVAGWGRLSNDKAEYPNQLQRVNLKIVGKEECARAWKEAKSEQESWKIWRAKYSTLLEKNIAGLVCATSPFHNILFGARQGDSGGPLVVDDKFVGVTSYRDPTGKAPPVFTDVAYYRKWVDEKILEFTTSTR